MFICPKANNNECIFWASLLFLPPFYQTLKNQRETTEDPRKNEKKLRKSKKTQGQQQIILETQPTNQKPTRNLKPQVAVSTMPAASSASVPTCAWPSSRGPGECSAPEVGGALGTRLLEPNAVLGMFIHEKNVFWVLYRSLYEILSLLESLKKLMKGASLLEGELNT